MWTVHKRLLEYFWQTSVRTCRTAATPHTPGSRKLTKGGRTEEQKRKKKKILHLGSDYTKTNQFHFTLVRAWCCFIQSLLLAQLYLSRVHSEEEHDGEACQQASILDGKGEKKAATTCILFFTTDLIHLWKLKSGKQNDNLVKLVCPFLNNLYSLWSGLYLYLLLLLQ